MMNKMAMGGVQLPYYNTNNDGTPKYRIGGLTKPQYEQAQADSMNLYNAGLKSNKIPSWQVPGAIEASARLTALNKEAPMPTKGSFYGNDSNYTGGYNVSFQKPTMVPYNMQTIDKKELVANVNRKPAISERDPNRPTWDFNSGVNPSFGGVSYTNAAGTGKVIPPTTLKYGGKMPKFEWGGEEDDNGFGYTPNNPAEAYRMQQASKMNNRIYSQKSSYAPSVLPWEKTNDSGNTPNNPYTFPVQEENPDMVNRRNDRLAREAAEIAGTGSEGTTDTTRTGGGNKYNNRDKMLQGIGMAASIAPELDYLKNQGKRYDTQKLYEYNPSLMDPTETIKGIKYAGKQSQENINIGSMGSGATLLANAAAQRNKTSADIAKATKDYDNANVAITNRGKEYNIGNRYAVDDINARNKGAALSNYYKTLDSAGGKVNQGTKDIRGGNQDNQMMAMIPKMINDPQFKKFFEEYQKGQVG